ncbi:ExbD/TolR family protein [Roseospira navarrensis]|uniref:Biopolymer transporter ExbD n=1 Tax=Roseospira navarrensis TaxID=140058 RepID=A0A7X1ZDT6_9PROT|nr:biopolymer transporter ExbD [Roseospira navarrensis]MQX35716.1 biopolymer transporter ExbD [Roseospira navarrensis]
MRLARGTAPRGSAIPLTPLVDVMLILLVFFMVTSTYLNLDMIPMIDRAEEDMPPARGATAGDAAGAAMLVRVRADGALVWQGRVLTPEALGEVLAARVTEDPGARLLVLPAGAATTQALVRVLDVAQAAGVRAVNLLRLDGP